MVELRNPWNKQHPDDIGVGTAMEYTVTLRQGPRHNVAEGSIGVVHVWEPGPDGRPARVLLATAPRGGEERRYELAPGDRFPLGTGLWEVRGIEPGQRRYTVRIVRVDDEAERRRQELRDKWSISPQAWAQSQQRVCEEEQRRAREVFGDREPFAVPESETDA
jgi:hypothetical protein